MRDKKVYGDNKVKTTGNYCPAPNTTGSCSNPRTLTTYEGEYSCIWLNGFGSIPGTWKCE